MMFLDLDRFKWVNDTLGHLAGDDLLIQVARRLTESLRENDTIARLGGDEFTVLLQDYASEEDIKNVAQKLLETFHDGFDIANQDIHISASIGIAVYPDDADNVDELLQCADTAMYSAKDLGRNRFSFYTDEMKQAAVQRLRLEQAMRSSIGRAEFLLHYQPVVDLQNGRCTGAEALVRWNRDGDQLVMPADFIGVAEETGFIDELGAWVMQTGLDQIGQWRAAGLDFRLAVNVSGVQLRDSKWLQSVGEWLEDRRGIASSFVMEFTESALIDCPNEVNTELQRLKTLGVRFALDDFGTGYSSLNYLRQFAMDIVKIDRSFVRQVAERPEDARLVKALVAMAESLNLEVVAEGIETEEQLTFLRDAGCGYGQGYLFGRPMAIEDFMRHRIPFTQSAGTGLR
jgi:diguanylate cyclase (GGDEF)-like protein